MSNDFAPIVLFAYNRPGHVKQTIDALKKNHLASESELFIYSDGPRSEDDSASVDKVRTIINNVDGFKNVSVIERDHNIGLGRSIIDGVTRIVNQYGKIIVLEDDIVTSPFFLSFMNEALEKYKNEERVMSISGYTPPMNVKKIDTNLFFMSWPDCWGWATWSRAWDLFERNPDKLVRSASTELIKKINVDGAAPSMWTQVMNNYNNVKYTWAIFFHSAICEHDGLNLYSKVSLTSNEGMDGSGDDSGSSTFFDVSKLRKDDAWEWPVVIEADVQAEEALKAFYSKVSSGSGFCKRVFNVMKKEGFNGLVKRINRYLNIR